MRAEYVYAWPFERDRVRTEGVLGGARRGCGWIYEAVQEVWGRGADPSRAAVLGHVCAALGARQIDAHELCARVADTLQAVRTQTMILLKFAQG